MPYRLGVLAALRLKFFLVLGPVLHDKRISARAVERKAGGVIKMHKYMLGIFMYIIKDQCAVNKSPMIEALDYACCSILEL